MGSEGYKIPRRKISKFMKQEGLVSKYTLLQFKPHRDKNNESKLVNLVDRKFDDQDHL